MQAHQPRDILQRVQPGSPLPSDWGPSHSARCVWVSWSSKKRGAALNMCNNLSLGRKKLAERVQHGQHVVHLLPRLIRINMAILVFWPPCTPALLTQGLTPDSLAPVPWTLFGWWVPETASLWLPGHFLLVQLPHLCLTLHYKCEIHWPSYEISEEWLVVKGNLVQPYSWWFGTLMPWIQAIGLLKACWATLAK